MRPKVRSTLNRFRNTVKANRMCTQYTGSSSGENVNNQTAKTKLDQIQQFSSFYSDSSESEEEWQSEDDTGEPPAKQNKQDSWEGDKRENDSNSKLLDNLFSDKSEHGPNVHENLSAVAYVLPWFFFVNLGCYIPKCSS